MKVRFYRGPWDGKVKHVQDHFTEIQVALTKPRLTYLDADNPYIDGNMLNYGPLTAIYRKTRHTHPDGSVFFEWDKKKGSRI